MEDKLLALKEQFCNWYCPNKGKVIDSDYGCSGEIYCGECGIYLSCDQKQQCSTYVELCEECKIEDYIKFIRDELNRSN